MYSKREVFIINLNDYIVDVVDFPTKGIIFKDITPLLKDGEAFHYVANEMAKFIQEVGADVICAPESRGFIFGCAISSLTKIGFVPVRKPGKLPRETISYTYSLEYGSDTLEMHKDAITKGQKVVIVDDVLATGGTIEAVANMVKQAGGIVVGVCVLGEIEALKPRERLKDYKVFSLMKY